MIGVCKLIHGYYDNSAAIGLSLSSIGYTQVIDVNQLRCMCTMDQESIFKQSSYIRKEQLAGGDG